MPNPTAADLAQAREVEYRLDLDDSDDGVQSRVDEIAHALAAARAEGAQQARAECQASLTAYAATLSARAWTDALAWTRWYTPTDRLALL
jgi:hypothetical protein